MVRAVTFDADGTLWDFAQVMREALGLALAAIRAHAPREAAALTIDDLIIIRDRVAAEPRSGRATLEQIRLAAFERTLAEIGRPDPALAARLCDAYMRHRFGGVRPFDDVIPALDALADRTLGVVSNGNSDPERCGLPGRFRFAVFADQHGARKPDRRLFEAAIARAGCPPARIVHVGDSLTEDVAGAQALGIRAVWLNRERRPNRTGIVPDAEIASLAELPALCS